MFFFKFILTKLSHPTIYYENQRIGSFLNFDFEKLFLYLV